jgi:N-methylhydantoinase A
MGYRVGIDVGGTFTDFLVVEPDGRTALWKHPTTPEDQSRGVIEGLRRIASDRRKELDGFLAATDMIIHGTTTADNAMIQGRGAKTGLLVTKGARDELELRRGYKENIWDPSAPAPTWIVPRRFRLPINERLDYQGNVLTGLDDDEVRRAVRRLRSAEIESIAVVFLFSFVNPLHEQRAGEIVFEEYPEVPMVSLSHEVHPAAPEFERTSTTVVNAFVGPLVQRYLTRLDEALRANGFGRQLLVMQSSGGIATAASVRNRPIVTLASGPAGGVMGACRTAAEAGIADFISVDMGGTSYDVCLVRNAQPTIKSFWNWFHRSLIALPMVDVSSIGAGGGSIARIIGGGLRVGPDSAGAEPGPISYGHGGVDATVTDANLVLGYLNPDSFGGGELPLKTDGIAEAIGDQIGAPLGLDATEAAWGIHRLTNADMNNAIVRVSAERGHDPREFALVVFGGNGAVHALHQAEELGISTVLVPKTAPAFSALGLLVSEYLVDKIRAVLVATKEAEASRLEGFFKDLERAADAELVQAKLPAKKFAHARFAQCRYQGQTWDIDVPVEGKVSAKELTRIAERFHEMHEAEHTYARRDEDVLIAALRVRSSVALDPPKLKRIGAGSGPPRPKAHRKAFFGGGFKRTAVYDGPTLKANQSIKGPAIVEEPFTTIVIPPGWTAKLDKLGNYVCTR